MYKLIITILLLVLVKTNIYASENLFIRLEQPNTPTHSQSFPLTYVVLDQIGSRNITITCESNGIQFYTTTLTAGGNTGSCPIDSSVIKNNGIYTIKVTAVAGEETASESVSVTYNNDSPDTLKDYAKNKIGDCTYEIKFKTADDNGKTAKVEIYRSMDKSFQADNGSRITEISVGSNTEKTYTDAVTECNKTYYYAVRAFSANGNGSGIVSDKEVKITEVEESSTTTTVSQAIPVKQAGSNSNIKPANRNTAASESGTILGIEESIATQSATPSAITKGYIDTIFSSVIALIKSFLAFLSKLFSR